MTTKKVSKKIATKKNSERLVTEIFISHSNRDKPVVDDLVDLICLCTDLKNEQIFCTCVEGMGCTNGVFFNSEIREKLRQSKVVITYLTKNYRNSEFCLAELGATWYSMDDKIFIPLLDPELGKAFFKGVINGVHLGDLNKDILLGMFETLNKLYHNTVKLTRIERKVSEFMDNYESKKTKCESSFFVTEKEWETKIDELEESLEKNAKLEDELKKLKKENELLKKAKSKEDVENAELAACDDVIEQYGKLIEKVKECSYDFNKFTMRFILLDNYNIENPDNVNYYADDITESVSNDYLRRNEDCDWPSVNYNEGTVEEYVSALDELRDFLEDSENVEDLSKYFKAKKIRFNINQLKFYQAILGV